MYNRMPHGASSGTNINGLQNPPWASTAMRNFERDVACAIQFGENLMISGEIGAGKQFFARVIHERCARSNAVFIVANCQDIMESGFHDSLDSGSVDQFKHPLLKIAGKATLVIKEIDKVSVPMQHQLLQFLESHMTNGSDLRLMTATRIDLFARVRAKQFSDRLFYRLNRIHLLIPALRDRPEDIPLLLHHYLSLYARADLPRLSAAALRRLVAYSWPGNVRELNAVAERLAVQDLPRPVEPDDLPAHIGREGIA